MIKRIHGDPIASGRTSPASRPPHAREGDAIQEASRPSRTDRVDISDAGRELAAMEGARPADSAGELTQARIDEIQGRIEAGAYNSVEFADQLARRIISVLV